MKDLLQDRMAKLYDFAEKAIRKGETIDWCSKEINKRTVLRRLAQRLQDLPPCPECGTGKPYICKMSCNIRTHDRSVFFHVV
jgi:hypothetical protein